MLDGGAGNDFIRSSSSSGVDPLDPDVLICGAGHDTFITDFGGGDLIDLSGMDAKTNRAGAQTFDFIGRDGFSGGGGEVRFVETGGDVLVKIDIGGNNTRNDTEILLEDVSGLNAGDFIL